MMTMRTNWLLSMCFLVLGGCSSNGNDQDADVTADAAGGADASDGATGLCASESSCARGTGIATLTCNSTAPNPMMWTSTLNLVPSDPGMYCRVRRDETGVDVEFDVIAADPNTNASEIYVRLPDFTGPGTYTVTDAPDRGDANRGMYIRANGGVGGDRWTTVGTSLCSSRCTAVVGPASSTPGAPAQGTVGRYTVELTCPEGLNTYSMPGCDSGFACTLSNATLRFEIACQF